MSGILVLINVLYSKLVVKANINGNKMAKVIHYVAQCSEYCCLTCRCLSQCKLSIHAAQNQIKSNQTNYFIVRLKVDQRAGQLSLPHLGITKTEKNTTKT